LPVATPRPEGGREENDGRPGSMKMKTRSHLTAILLVLALAIGAAGQAKAAPHPLSADDITLLLVGGASPQKLVSLIHQRGIDFKLTPELAKQFYQDGATDDVVDAIQRASQNAKVESAPPSQPTSSSSSQPQPGPQPVPGNQPQESPPALSSHASGPTPIAKPVTATPPVKPVPPTVKAASKPMPPPSDAPLSDPNPAEIQHIIQTFAAKEETFREARDNYTYHQINKVETLDANNDIDGTWEQDWDILFNGSGQRIEKVTYAPPGDLKGILITQQDINAFRNIQPFVLTTDQLPEYNIRYLGHVHLDYLTTYVFSVRPKEIKKNHQYFDGTAWVDDHDLQIVKEEGRNVPQTKNNRFPRFSTWRQQIDGKYWFPTFTLADDTLYFDGAPPVHIKEIVKYTDYHWFGSRTRIISVSPISSPAAPGKPKH
jgi:hypothetical protein